MTPKGTRKHTPGTHPKRKGRRHSGGGGAPAHAEQAPAGGPNPQIDVGTIIGRQAQDPIHAVAWGWRPDPNKKDEVWIFYVPDDGTPGFTRFGSQAATFEVNRDGDAPAYSGQDPQVIDAASRTAFRNYAKVQRPDLDPTHLARFRVTTYTVDAILHTKPLAGARGMFNGGVYAVTQTNHPSGSTDHPVAWVWRPVNSQGDGVPNEIWLLLKPLNNTDGYYFPGHVMPKSAPSDPDVLYSHATFRIEPEPQADPSQWVTNNCYDVAQFRQWVYDQYSASIANMTSPADFDTHGMQLVEGV